MAPADLEVQFASQTVQYRQIPFHHMTKGCEALITGTIPLTLTEFKIDPATLLALPVKNEIPVHVEMKWRLEQ